MIEVGHLALCAALVAATLQTVLPLLAGRGDTRLMMAAAPLSIAQCVLVGLSFGVLVLAYVTSDFSVANVWSNSHSAQPLVYRITSTWGNHEGSLLLWTLILALFGASVALFGSHLPIRLKSLTLAVQGSVSVAFLLLMLLTSNPFARLAQVPGEGQDLNPILQDLGLAIHPPLLYVGYVGFSITFAFAVAALIEGRVDTAWARWVRPWALGAWAFLTLGIAMGSYWAYYELGWGGWWFWDPVENASLLPWLSGTALLHSAIVVEKRGALKTWTILLALLTFALSLLGTFLVRSGVLTSVHTFATDPARGLAILAILVLFVGGSFTLFAARAQALQTGTLFAPVSREMALVLNNFLLTAAAVTVLVGTLYPVAYEAITGGKISVGPPFFNLAVTPMFVVLALIVPFGPFMPWKRADLVGTVQRLTASLVIAGLLGLAIWTFLGQGTLAPLGIALGAFVCVGSIAELVWRARVGTRTTGEAFVRLGRTKLAAWGGATAHFGIGVVIIGVTASSAWQTETLARLAPGETVTASGYSLTFDRIEPVTGPNWREDRAVFQVGRNDQPLFNLAPSKRLYEARQSPTTEAAIYTFWTSQLYLSLGDAFEDGSVVLRAYYKPWITLIWIGAIIMAMGGALSLADRRLRVGVPARRAIAVPA